MTTKITTVDQADLQPGSDPCTFVAWASDLRFPVDAARWPAEFTVRGFGNGQPFRPHAPRSPGCTTYRQDFGLLTIRIFND